MTPRQRTLSLKMTDDEILQTHALADHADDSVGRYLRRLVAREYARLFGDAPPPNVKTRMGRPRKSPSKDAASLETK